MAAEPRSAPTEEAATVLVVPGAGVRRYVEPVIEALAKRGHVARLLPGPGQQGGPSDLSTYGRGLATKLSGGPGAELVVGLSVGSQAAAIAAAVAGSDVRRLLLVSPTVDPDRRTVVRFLGRWAAAGRLETPALLAQQLPDWRQAGGRALAEVVRSALRVHLETVLTTVTARLTVVHAEDDGISGHSFAARLATQLGGRLVVVPQAVHSWPYRDPERFADIVEDVLS